MKKCSVLFLFSWLIFSHSALAAKFLTPEQVVAKFQSNVDRKPSAYPPQYDLPSSAVDLRSDDSEVDEQFGGTCSAFATANAMDNLLHQKKIDKQISKRDLWSFYQKFDADDAVEAATKNFITEYDYYPNYSEAADDYQEHRSVRISQSVKHEYNLMTALQGLAQNHPLVMAIQVPQDVTDCKITVSPDSVPTSGEHVVAAVGYVLDTRVSGGGYFILKNSWGKKCGDHGYQYYPFSLCTRTDLYCYFNEISDLEVR
jgi:C1A family cysteine protease